MPYLDQQSLFKCYRRDLPWNSAENAEAAATPVWTYQCPAQKYQHDEQGRFLTSYAILHGQNCIWRHDGPLPLNKISDGASNTIAIVEACGQNIVWNEPRDIDVEKTPLAINLAGKKPHESPAMVSSLHLGGGPVLMSDGTVRFLSSHIDPKTLEALTTADGGEPVGEY